MEVRSAPSFASDNLFDFQADPLFQSIDREKQGFISLHELLRSLERQGIQRDDPRLLKFVEETEAGRADYLQVQIRPAQFEEFLKQHAVAKNALTQNLIIPDFEDFCNDLTEMYESTRKNEGGKVADYIPQLARVNPEQFAVSVCTIDGQRFSLGEAEHLFCLQSTCKPINYCLAIEEHGTDIVHRYVGREPSGRSFNELSLNQDGLPHNPMINAGAIMCTSLLRQELDMADRFDYVLHSWERLCAGKHLRFNNSVYLSERQTADRNFALAYFMRENKAFPEGTDLIETLEFYFQCCSIESSTRHLSVAAATLAHSGINPLNGERIFNDKTIQHCMSLMLSCGMYDFSGEFAFKIGLPAKSGVSGAMLLVIPNVMGMSIWSPRLDRLGNSVRGVEFCERLIEKYNFHNYDTLTRNTEKKNPRKQKFEDRANQVVNLIYAASSGDLDEICRLDALGVSLSQADYDGRTALHLASAENQTEVVRYLIERGVPLEARDRWGGTPLDDAKRHQHPGIVALLEQNINGRRSDNGNDNI